MSNSQSEQENMIESAKNQLRLEIDDRIGELVPALIDGPTVSRSAVVDDDGEGTEPEPPDVVSGLNILFLKDKEYVESIADEVTGYPKFGIVSKPDAQGNYSVSVGCKISDTQEASDYWVVEYSIVEVS